MGKAEESYKYALKKDKYDSEVRKSVDKKVLSKKDANTVNNIQEMMRKEKEEQRNKASRTVVTSENRAEFMAKKLKLAKEEKPVMKEEKPAKPYAIWNIEDESKEPKIHSHYATEEEAKKAYQKEFGGNYSGDRHTLGSMTSSEMKKYGYK
jgi:hypothetical protein